MPPSNPLTSRRFVLGGHAGTVWFIVYERGGRGHHLVLAVIDTSTEAVRVSMVAKAPKQS